MTLQCTWLKRHGDRRQRRSTESGSHAEPHSKNEEAHNPWQNSKKRYSGDLCFLSNLFRSWCVTSENVVGASSGVLGCLFGTVFGPFWRHLGAAWGRLGGVSKSLALSRLEASGGWRLGQSRPNKKVLGFLWHVPFACFEIAKTWIRSEQIFLLPEDVSPCWPEDYAF